MLTFFPSSAPDIPSPTKSRTKPSMRGPSHVLSDEGYDLYVDLINELISILCVSSVTEHSGNKIVNDHNISMPLPVPGRSDNDRVAGFV